MASYCFQTFCLGETKEPLKLYRGSWRPMIRFAMPGAWMSGMMFLFVRNRFCGSYLAFSAARRENFSSPCAARKRFSPSSSLRKSTPEDYGRIASPVGVILPTAGILAGSFD